MNFKHLHLITKNIYFIVLNCQFILIFAPMKDKLETIALGIFTLALLFTFVFNLLIRIV